jgi:hypothetical protein
MSPSCRRLLRAASVFGEIFWQDALGLMIDDGPAERETLLATLVESEAIVERGGARFPGTREYAFRHALLRSAVYAMLTEEDRRLGHRLAADWLAASGRARTVAIHWRRRGARASGGLLREGGMDSLTRPTPTPHDAPHDPTVHAVAQGFDGGGHDPHSAPSPWPSM